MTVSRKIKILLVEDSPTVRTLYKHTFEKEGFEVLEAEDGQTAWTLANEDTPDVIVLDMILPDFHGLDLLKNIRANKLTEKIPVLVLTSLKEIQDVQKAITMGANHYCVKGSDSPEKILSMIYKLLTRV